MNVIPLINGRTYDYVSITLSILGVPLEAVKAINYGVEQPKENQYGTGPEPVSRGKGAKTYTASLEIPMEEVEKIRAASTTGSLVDLDMFDVVVFFGVQGKFKTHTIKNCEFSVDGVEASQGDTQISKTFDLTPSHIVYGNG
jgi:hypothetical protein